MKKLILIAIIAASQFASATVAPELIENLSETQTASLESRLQDSVKSRLQLINLRQFNVDWNAARCLDVQNEMDESNLYGSCVIKFSAFQVQGEASLTFKDNGGIDLSIIYVNLE